jgi:signal transduction histidine kinase
MSLQQHGPAHAAALTVSEAKAVVVKSGEWNPDISARDPQETLSVPFPPSGPATGALTLTRPATPDGFARGERTIALTASSLLGVTIGRSLPGRDSDPSGRFHQQRLEVLGRLASSAAHDLNNLLMAIEGYTELLNDELTPDHPGTEDIRAIKQATSRSIELVRAVLGFSRESGDQQITEMNTVVRDIGRLLDQVAGGQIVVTRTLSPGRLETRIDSIQLEQVLVNLVANARDASKGGGTVEIETSRAPSANGAAPGGDVRLTVRDSGTGITDEVKAHIFDPFFTTKARASGTGLGLATVSEIIRLAGGSVEVESQPGRGTTFTVLLPALPPAAD